MKEKRYLDSGKLGRVVSKARHLPALGTHDFLTCKYFELLLTHWLETACIIADQRPEGHGVSIVMMTTYKLESGIGVRDWRASRLKAQHGGLQRSGEHTDNELSAASASIPGVQHSVQFSSVAQSCPTLCDPMNCSTPGLPVHHQLPEFAQTHVQRVGDAIQPAHPLSSPSPAPNPSQHQGLFQ